MVDPGAADVAEWSNSSANWDMKEILNRRQGIVDEDKSKYDWFYRSLVRHQNIERRRALG